MVHFAETNQIPSPNSMLQHIGRVETPKLVPRTCLRYLQTTLIMSGGDWSQNLCEVLSKRKMESKQGFGETCHLIFLILDIWDMPSSFMTNWVTAWSLWPSKKWSVEIMGRYNGFLSLEVNILSIQSVIFLWYAIPLEHR